MGQASQASTTGERKRENHTGCIPGAIAVEGRTTAVLVQKQAIPTFEAVVGRFGLVAERLRRWSRREQVRHRYASERTAKAAVLNEI